MRLARAARHTNFLSILLATLLLGGCARVPPLGHLAEGAASVEVPSEFVGSHVFVQVELDGSEPVWLLLDSGTEMTVLDVRAARRLGIAFDGTSEIAGIGPNVASGGITSRPLSIRVVGSEPYHLRRPVTDLSSLEPVFGRAIHGILGGDLFTRFIVEIDYAEERVTLHDPRSFRPRYEDVRVELAVVRQLPYVESGAVLPDGRQVSGRFLIDSGSDAAVFFYAQMVSAHALLEALPGTIDGATAGVGGESTYREGRLAAFRLGPFHLHEPTASFALAPSGASTAADEAGIIGADVLRRFTVTFDYRRGALYLRPNQRLAQPFEANMAGFGVLAIGTDFREFVVLRVDPDSPAHRAGLAVDDVILEVNGRRAGYMTVADIRRLARDEPGRVLMLQIRRGTETIQVQVTLERRI